jgi:hypothetical protein
MNDFLQDFGEMESRFFAQVTSHHLVPELRLLRRFWRAARSARLARRDFRRVLRPPVDPPLRLRHDDG